MKGIAKIVSIAYVAATDHGIYIIDQQSQLLICDYSTTPDMKQTKLPGSYLANETVQAIFDIKLYTESLMICIVQQKQILIGRCTQLFSQKKFNFPTWSLLHTLGCSLQIRFFDGFWDSINKNLVILARDANEINVTCYSSTLTKKTNSFEARLVQHSAFVFVDQNPIRIQKVHSHSEMLTIFQLNSRCFSLQGSNTSSIIRFNFSIDYDTDQFVARMAADSSTVVELLFIPTSASRTIRLVNILTDNIIDETMQIESTLYSGDVEGGSCGGFCHKARFNKLFGIAMVQRTTFVADLSSNFGVIISYISSLKPLRDALLGLRAYASVFEIIPSSRSHDVDDILAMSPQDRISTLESLLVSIESTRAARAIVFSKEDPGTLCGSHGCISSEFVKAFRIQIQALTMVIRYFERFNSAAASHLFRLKRLFFFVIEATLGAHAYCIMLSSIKS